jgi:hypothetical protein
MEEGAPLEREQRLLNEIRVIQERVEQSIVQRNGDEAFTNGSSSLERVGRALEELDTLLQGVGHS